MRRNSKLHSRLWFGGVALVALLVGYYFSQNALHNHASHDHSVESLEFFNASAFPDPVGKQVPLNGLLKELNVVNFWATWCAPCRHEMPTLQAFYDENNANGVTVIGLTLDDPEPTERFIQELGISYPIVMLGDNGWDLLSQSGNEKGLLPYTLLIDESVNVLEKKLGIIDVDLLQKWIEKHSISSKM